MLDVIIASLSAAAVRKLAGDVVSDGYKIAKEKVAKVLQNRKISEHADKLAKHIYELKMVKTIWQADKAIDFLSFYCPPKIEFDRKRLSVHKLQDFPSDGSFVIEGTVGQGKSILLRYLAISDFCFNKRIPIFIELRKLQSGQKLEMLTVRELITFGFNTSESEFDYFAENGKISLFLDGFDELKYELRQDVLDNIERLIRKYSKLILVITTRPDSGVSSSAYMPVYRLGVLRGKEYEQVIRRMTEETSTAEAMIKGINSETCQISQLLTTPLMVALLVFRYNIDCSLPANTMAFYESLFRLLLQRHDKNKGGWQRPRFSNASDSELKAFFNAIAFLGSKNGAYSFSQSQIESYCGTASGFTNAKADPSVMLDDIITITCLILRDSQETRFIHRSVQEYHAALFIRDLPDVKAHEFYAVMCSKWSRWRQELFFLSMVDKYRYDKYFYMPLFESKLLNGRGYRGVRRIASKQFMVKLLTGIVAEYDYNTAELLSVQYPVTASPVLQLSNFSFWKVLEEHPMKRSNFISHHQSPSGQTVTTLRSVEIIDALGWDCTGMQQFGRIFLKIYEDARDLILLRDETASRLEFI